MADDDQNPASGTQGFLRNFLGYIFTSRDRYRQIPTDIEQLPLFNDPPETEFATPSREQRREVNTIIRNRREIIRYSTTIIYALQELVDYDAARHHNAPPPTLRLEGIAPKDQITELIAELRRLNGLLEAASAKDAAEAQRTATKFARHFDKFLDGYFDYMGKGAAALTISVAVALLYRAGVGQELIDALWGHLKIAD
jgi:hypothetical protein